jgi:hypothetical protein
VRHLRDDTVLILDGEVRVYRRERSRRWQTAFSIDGKPIRISTGKKDLNEAKTIARMEGYNLGFLICPNNEWRKAIICCALQGWMLRRKNQMREIRVLLCQLYQQHLKR